jgi:outer membrane protein assembly factor BamB
VDQGRPEDLQVAGVGLMLRANAAGKVSRIRASGPLAMMTRRQALSLAAVPAVTMLAGGCAGATGAGAARPAVEWRVPVADPIYAALDLSGGQVLVSATTGLTAVRAATGATIWRFPSGWRYPNAPLASTGATYIIGRENARLYALSSESGRQQWSFSRTGTALSAPLAGGPALYVAATQIPSTDTTFYALDARNGSPLWEAAGFPVTMTGDVIYSYTTGVKLSALAKDTGQRLWSFDSPGGPLHTVMLSGDRCYVVCDLFINDSALTVSRVNALDRNSGTLIWAADLGGDSVSLVTAAGRVYAVGTTLGVVGGSGPNIIAVDARSGETAWITTVPHLCGGALVAGGCLLAAGSPPAADGGIASSGGVSGETELCALDLSTGEVRWRSSGSGPYLAGPPIQVGNTVVVAFSFRSLRGVDLETGNTAWSMPLKMMQAPVVDGGRILAVAADEVSAGLSAGSKGAVYAIRP